MRGKEIDQMAKEAIKEIDQMAEEATSEQKTVPILPLLNEAVEAANYATYRIDVLRVLLFGDDERGLEFNEPKECENVMDAAIELVKYLQDMNEMLNKIEKGVMP